MAYGTLIPVAVTGVLSAAVIGLWISAQSDPEQAAGEVEVAAIVPEAPSRPSIAVLPFVVRADSDVPPEIVEELADQVTKNLMSAAGLTVSPRDAVAVYEGGVRPSVGEISYELRVRYIVQVMVDGQANDLRVDARLDDGMTGYTLWTGSFWAERFTLFDLHGEISDAILKEIGLEPAAP